jgi:O-antigen/teichoic acid export membrane protein
MFQIVLMYALVLHTGIVTAAGATIAWYFLVCDVLYYWALEIKLDSFSWFQSSPVVFVFQRILKRPAAPVWSVLASSIVGLALAMSLTFIF